MKVDKNTLENRILQDIYSSVLVLDKKGTIQYINDRASHFLEIPNDIEPGTTHFATNIDNSYNDKFCEYIFNAIYQKDISHTGTVKFLSPSGKKYFLRISSSYLESQNYIVITLDDLTLENTLTDKVKTSSYVFSAFLFLMSIWVLFCEFWDMTGRKIPTDTLTIIIEVMWIFIFVFIMVFTNLPLKDLGIVSNNNKRDVMQGIIISAICAAGLFAIKIVGLSLGIA